ncbi:ATP-binding protein, partial [Candidatus Zixiibacteriota bacterium]
CGVPWRSCYTLIAAHLDLGFERDNDEDLKRLRQFFEKSGCEYLIEKTDIGIHAHSEHNRKNPCFLCARLRRKRIYELAQQTGCNTIAMGHHKDDIVETFLLNVFFSREISTMVPNQPVFSGKFKIIRPLAYIDEYLIKSFAKESRLPVLNNACPTSGASYRTMVKELLAELEQKHPGVRNNIFKALSNVKLEYLLS